MFVIFPNSKNSLLTPDRWPPDTYSVTTYVAHSHTLGGQKYGHGHDLIVDTVEAVLQSYSQTIPQLAKEPNEGIQQLRKVSIPLITRTTEITAMGRLIEEPHLW